jgi:tetratricopeptide (TPR) repeat protein
MNVKGLGILLTCCIQLCISHIVFADKIDSLITISKKVKGKDRADTYNQLAWEYCNRNQDSTYKYANEALDLAKSLRYDKGIGYAYTRMAIAERNMGQVATAEAHAIQALTHFVLAGYDKKGIASAYNTLASIYLQQDALRKATHYFTLSAQLSISINDWAGYAASKNNIGVIYQETKQIPKALEIFEAVYTVSENLKDENGMADALNNIASIYHDQHLLDTAIVIYKRALDINILANDIRDAATINLNIGTIYRQQNELKKALDYMLRAMNAFKQMNDMASVVICLNSIARSYIGLEMYHIAEQYLDESKMWAVTYKMPTEVLNAYEMRYEIENKQGRYKEAITYLEQYKKLSDSIMLARSNIIINAIENENELLKKEKDTLTLRHEREIYELSKKERDRHILQYVSMIAVVLLLFVLIFYVVFFIVRKNDNKP